MKYDDASWHYGGDFPDDLPVEAGATHIGMFVTWCLLNGLAGSMWIDDFPRELEALRKRMVTPGQFFLQSCDEKFVDEELNEKGNEFAEAYYQGSYFGDYENTLAANLPSCYHVADGWETFDKFSPVIATRFDQWQKGELKDVMSVDTEVREPKPWWKIW